MSLNLLQSSRRCDNREMRKSLTTFALLALSTILFANAGAQTTAAKPKTPAATAVRKPATAAKTSTKPVSPATTTLTTDKEKASYALGMNIAAALQSQGVDAETDPAIVAQALKDMLTKSKLLLTEDDAKKALVGLQLTMRKIQLEKAEKAAAANKAEAAASKAEGAAFLTANKTKEGVVALPSGLQYKIITNGTGPKPTAKDTVVCNYRGTLLNGKEFDSSYRRNEPATFEVGQVIPGWVEALQLMPVGSKWQVWIPSDLAYGDRQPGPEIKPGSTLVFEIELLSIKQPEAAKPEGEAPKADAPKTETQPAK